MNIQAFRSYFIVGVLALMLLAASPTLAMFLHLPDHSERYSELWLLGPEHRAENYPFNIVANKTYWIFLGVGNYLGHSAYYRVLVKLRNQSQLLPAGAVGPNSTPSPLSALYEFNIFVRNGEVAERLLRFKIIRVNRSENVISVNEISINEGTFPVTRSAAWSDEGNGFYYQFFFELWLFNATAQRHYYDGRFVGFWVNMTA